MEVFMISKGKQISGFIVSVLITFIAAAIGSVASVNAGQFYAALSLPSFAPPGWLFGPVWTVLYILMAVSAWTVWRERGFSGAKGPLVLYLVQLALNALWTWLFFGFHYGLLAFCEILLLWCMIVAMTALFWRIRPLAAVLLVPYLAWVSFACVLTYVVWTSNPHILR
jgi:tryptophan-rich sensory protein